MGSSKSKERDMREQVDEPMREPTPTCQICFAAFDDSEARLSSVEKNENGSANTDSTAAVVRVGKLCGERCSAEICRACLQRHLHVSLDACCTGVLPKLRCPICLKVLRKDQWEQHADGDVEEPTTLLGKYRERARQSCALTPPCCHKEPYTQLTPVMEGDPSNWEESAVFKECSAPDKIVPLQEMCVAFCNHEKEASQVVNYVTTIFTSPSEHVSIIVEVLQRLQDEERRAALQLAYMYRYPNIKTRCCQYSICFNCKRVGACNGSCEAESFNEAESIVRCRSCRTMLLKVQGCDTVRCPCGFVMNWPSELKYRRMYTRKLLPFDLFDAEAFTNWNLFRSNRHQVSQAIARLHAKWRMQRLNHLLATHRPLLQAALARHRWRRYFRKLIPQIQRELYWALYFRSHREEEQAEQDAFAELLAMRPWPIASAVAPEASAPIEPEEQCTSKMEASAEIAPILRRLSI